MHLQQVIKIWLQLYKICHIWNNEVIHHKPNHIFIFIIMIHAINNSLYNEDNGAETFTLSFYIVSI